MSYYNRLQSLSLYSIWGRLLRADLILVWKILCSDSTSLTGLLQLSNNSRTRGHPLKLLTIRSNTEIRKRFFTARVVSIWNNLPADVVTSPSLEIFKTRLPPVLGDLLYFYCDWFPSLACCLFCVCSMPCLFFSWSYQDHWLSTWWLTNFLSRVSGFVSVLCVVGFVLPLLFQLLDCSHECDLALGVVLVVCLCLSRAVCFFCLYATWLSYLFLMTDCFTYYLTTR